MKNNYNESLINLAVDEQSKYVSFVCNSQTKRKRNFLRIGLSALLSFAFLLFSFNQSTAQTICNNEIGEQGGYTYEYWKDQGTGCMDLGSGGTFSTEWNNINNLLARKGLRPGSMNQTVTYGANYQPNGNSYLCIYGWTTSPLVEYYIVDSWGTWRPPGGTPKGTVTTDGGTYDIYETTRTQQPSIEGTQTFQQYWSVRTSKRTSGTISVGNHFAAWENVGMNMGNLYEVSFCVEGYQSSGTCDVYEMTMGTSSGGNTGGGNSGGGNSGGGTSDQGDGEYTLTVRARGVAGGEHLNVLIDNQVQAQINLSTSMQSYDVYVDAGDLNIEFDNDGGDRDVEVDYIQIHGETIQAEDMEYNTAVYQNDSCGGSYSEMMQCNGVIGFGDITYQSSGGGDTGGGNSGSGNIVVRASGVVGDESITISVGGSTAGTFTLSTSMQNYSVSGSGMVRVEFTNDGGDRDVQVDYITIDGTTYQAEDQETNTAVYQDGSCGGSYSEMMHCGGYIEFGSSNSGGGTNPDPTPDPDPNPTGCGGIQTWSSSGVYSAAGTQVVYNGNIYENRWYSSGQNPEQNSGQWQVWVLVGSCSSAKMSNSKKVESASDQKDIQFAIYPSPSPDGKFQILSVNKIENVKVYDMNGRLIKDIQSGKKSIERLELKVNSGMYIANFVTKNGNKIIKRLIIE